MSVVDCDIAWSNSLSAVSLDDLSDPAVSQSLALRRANVTLRAGDIGHRLLGKRLSALPAHCKLVALEIAADESSDAVDWAQIVALPCIQHLRSFALTGYAQIDAQHIRALAALPHLAALRVEGRVVAPEDFAAFAASPSLTSLVCYDVRSDGDDRGSVLGFVLPCPTLTRLHLLEPHDRILDGFSPLFAMPGIEHIRDLTLSGMAAVDWSKRTDPQNAADSPAGLLSLQSLTIQICVGIDNLLPHLRLAPALRSLTIEPSSEDRSTIPSAAVLVELLAAVPALSVRVRGGASDFAPSDIVDAHDQLSSSAELRAFGARFAIEAEE